MLALAGVILSGDNDMYEPCFLILFKDSILPLFKMFAIAIK
jgi:hypothetical protein